ncbi:hypothetical protein [Desulfobacter sp.]
MEQNILNKMKGELNQARHLENAADHIVGFMKDLYHLGREIDRINPDELDAFLKETSQLILELSNPLDRYLFSAEDRLLNEFYGDEWIKVCRERSSIAFFRSLYRDYVDDDWDLFMDCENFDDMLMQKGNFEGGGIDPVPKGIPASHWWWWYPQKPPGHR